MSNMLKILEEIRSKRAQKQTQAANEPAWFSDSSKPRFQSTRPSLLSRGTHFIGEIEHGGAMLIAGQMQGKIRLDVLKISKHGHFKGEIHSKILHVNGHFDGHGVCDILTIGPCARISANIRYKVVRIAHGASITGQLSSELKQAR